MAEVIKLSTATGLALDANGERIYWRGSFPFPSDVGMGIRRFDLTDLIDEVLVELPRPPGTFSLFGTLALDPVSEYLFWDAPDGIWRSDLDGNDAQLIIPGASNVASMVVAPVPEPSAVVLAMLGLVGLVSHGWRRKVDHLRKSRRHSLRTTQGG